MNQTVFCQEFIRRRIRELGPWFHNIQLVGIPTAPNHFLGDYPNVKWRRFSSAIPDKISGATVLDIGCNAGFYAIEMKMRGAERVVGIDSDDGYLAQARFAADVLDLEIEFKKLSVYDVAELKERFDIVLFMGVLYHLRYPLLALDMLHSHVVRDTMIFQSMLRGSGDLEEAPTDADFWSMDMFDKHSYPKMHFIEHSYAGDPTNWWAPNASCAAAMLRSAGFAILCRPEEEVFICKRIERNPLAGEMHPASGAIA